MYIKKGFSIFAILILCCSFFVTAQEADASDAVEAEEKPSLAGEAVVPPAARPRAPDAEKVSAAEQKDDSPKDIEKNKRTLEFGMSEEIISLINKFVENEDPRLANDVYDLFQETKSVAVRDKIVQYFTKLEDPCILDYAVAIVNEPFDEKQATVSGAIEYIKTVKYKDAIPPLIAMIEADNDDYFNDAVVAVGELGGSEEAVYLTDLFENDDTSTNRKQSLMRALGKIGATETWDKLVDIAQNKDENSFVRMYAAEALGNMKKNESVEVLVELFEDTDPNLRQYVMKGLINFSGNPEAEKTIIQGIRDDYFRVRIESIKAAGDMELKAAIPSLIFRAENDKEAVVKKECWPVIAKLNTQEGNDFLVGILTDKKKGDGTKTSAAEALLKAGNVGEAEILELVKKSLTDDKQKQLRYGIGKALVKNVKPSFADVCNEFLASKDVPTVAIGLDMYKAGRFSSVESAVRAIAENKKSGNNQKYAKRILGIEDDE